jgi:hypothetical protein
MYVLYSVMTDKSVHIQWLPTEEDCLKFIQSAKVWRYKCLPIEKQRPLTFSAAFEWCEEKGDLVTNMKVAHEMFRNNLRLVRDELWPKINAATLSALADGDTEKLITVNSLKSELKDVTALPLPDTEEELVKFNPDIFDRVRALKI